VGVGAGRTAGPAAPFPPDEAVAIIEEEFGCSLRNIFAYLSMEPVAAASFGQVADDKGSHVIDNVCVVLVGRIWSPDGNINYLFLCKGLHEDVTEFVVTGIPWVQNRWTRGGCQSSDLTYSSVLPRMCAFFELRCTPLPSSQMFCTKSAIFSTLHIVTDFSPGVGKVH
jgi:hypothetical protein